MRAFFFALLLGALAFAANPAEARRRPAPSPTATAASSPTPVPLSETARIERMRAQLDTIVHEAPGRLGVAVLDITHDTQVSVRGDETFPLASVFKLAIAVAAYRRADQHHLDLDTRVQITRGDLRRGASDIAADHPQGGAWYTYWELIREMLVTSDNTATDVVLRAVGGPSEVQALLRRLNVRDLTIRKSEATIAADDAAHVTFEGGGDNGGTPNAVARLLKGIATQRFALLDSTNELLLALENVHTGPGRLRAGLPAGAKFAHKTGSSATFGGTTDATNDAGVLTLPDGRRIAIVALLANSHADETVRDATLARVARAVADAYLP